MIYDIFITLLLLAGAFIITLTYFVAAVSVAMWITDELLYGTDAGVFVSLLWMICALALPVAVIATLAKNVG